MRRRATEQSPGAASQRSAALDGAHSSDVIMMLIRKQEAVLCKPNGSLLRH